MFETACASHAVRPEGYLDLPRAARANFADDDADGLSDDEENELAERFAPIVILHTRDRHRPASLTWLLARTDPFQKLRRDSHSAGMLARRVPAARASDGRWRTGSSDASHWTTYVHTYERTDGGVNLQYWFFYPYNDGPLFFDHDHDWEHITVRLDQRREPLGVDFAQHANDDPGVSTEWRDVKRFGDHPLVHSALGTHASYGALAEIAWFEDVASCRNLETCGHPVWKTWQGGGLENLGERGRPLCHDQALSFRGRWGSAGVIPGTSAPFGPHYHRGYCVEAASGCSDERAPVLEIGQREAAIAR